MTIMTLSNKPRIPAEYEATVLETLRLYYERLTWEMREAFGLYDIPILTNDALFLVPMAETLAGIARAAAGERKHDEFNDGVLNEEIQSVMESLFSTPVAYAYTIPDVFWTTELGKMLARARLWLRNDLITIADAAKKYGISVQAVSQAVDSGRLQTFVDPDTGARQGRRLISESEAKFLWGSEK